MEGEKRMMKRHMEEVYGSDPAECFNKEKRETKEHYRALFRLANEHRRSESEWNEASSKAKFIAPKMDLLDVILMAKGNFDFVAELEKLKAEHMEAEGNLADVKVKVPDWFKLGGPWMMDD
ncbi:hypothetical protein Bca52824_017009 [Brassica carinata]|uniref:Uncharacterized protein n=1 Tax=Brassica carinata TaxID=52824 RepID=A0A8X8AXU4_BRACI|nr:hypothetical protein Bca52824_017009 [Brassica carinata]